jgi:hypothetical protein
MSEAVGAVLVVPGAAMDLQNCGEWAIAGRLVKARQALLAAGALVDDVLAMNS